MKWHIYPSLSSLIRTTRITNKSNLLGLLIKRAYISSSTHLPQLTNRAQAISSRAFERLVPFNRSSPHYKTHLSYKQKSSSCQEQLSMVDVETKIQLTKFRIQLMFRDHLDDMFPAHLFKFLNYIYVRKKIRG